MLVVRVISTVIISDQVRWKSNLRMAQAFEVDYSNNQLSAARLVFRLSRYDHVSDTPVTLHWLRLAQRVDFKVAVMAFRVLHGLLSLHAPE